MTGVICHKLIGVYFPKYFMVLLMECDRLVVSSPSFIVKGQDSSSNNILVVKIIRG